MPSDSGAAWTPPAGAGAGERRLSNSSDGSACSGYSKALSTDSADFLATRAHTATVLPGRPAANPLQFIKVGPAELGRSAREQLRRAELAQRAGRAQLNQHEDWQSNLDNWKSSRRKRVEHIIERCVEVRRMENEPNQPRGKSKTFNEMMEERAGRRRRNHLALYTDEDGHDLSDLGIGTSSTKSSLSEDCDTHSLASDGMDLDKNNSDVDNMSNCDMNNRKLGSSANEYDTCTTTTISSPEPEEYTYEGAIEGYKSRIISQTNSNMVKTVVSNNNVQKNESNLKATSNGDLNKIKTTVSSKLEDKLSSFQQEKIGDVKNGNQKKDLPKIDIHKRREQFERENSQETQLSKLPEIANKKSIKERLSSLEKFTEETHIQKSITDLTKLPADVKPLKERLSSLEKVKSASVEPEKVKRFSNGDLTNTKSLKERLSNLKSQTSEEDLKVSKKEVNEVSMSLKQRLSCLDAACNKEIPKITIEEEKLNTTNEIETKESITVYSQEKKESSLKSTLSGIENQMQSFCRSLDSLDINGQSSPNSLERVQSLEDFDCPEMQNNSIPSDIETEDSGIHTALDSCVHSDDIADLIQVVSPVEEPMVEVSEYESSNEDANQIAEEALCDTDVKLMTEAINNVTVEEVDDNDVSKGEDTDSVSNYVQAMSQPLEEMSVTEEITEIQMDKEDEDTLKSLDNHDTSVIDALEMAFKEIDSEEDLTKAVDANDHLEKAQESIFHEDHNKELTRAIVDEMDKKINVMPLYENIDIFNQNISVESDVTFPLDLASNALEPPKEKPPPPPTEDNGDDELLGNGNFKHTSSARRIKKEIRNKRTSFLGIEGQVDDSYLDVDLKLAPRPDITLFLQQESKIEKLLYKKTLSHEMDSNLRESRDSGVDVDKSPSSDWNNRQNSSPETSNPHSRQNSETYTHVTVTSDEDETSRQQAAQTFTEKLSAKLETFQNQEEQNTVDQNKIEKLDKKLQQQQMRRCAIASGDGFDECHTKEVLRIERELLQLEQEELRRQRENLLRESQSRLMQKSVQDVTVAGNTEKPDEAQMRPANQSYRHSMPNLLANDNYMPVENKIQIDKPTYRSDVNLKRKPLVSVEHMQKHFGVEESRKILAESFENKHYNNTVKRYSMDGNLQNYNVNKCYNNKNEEVKNQIALTQQTVKPPQPILPPKPRSRESIEREITMRSSRVPSAVEYVNVDRANVQLRQKPAQAQVLSANNSSYHPMSRHTLQVLSAAPTSKLISSSEWMQPKAPARKPHNYNYNHHWLIQEAEQRRIEELRNRIRGQPPPAPAQRHSYHEPTNAVPRHTLSGSHHHLPQDLNKPELEAPRDDKILSVSGKRKCSHCGDELGRGAAMIIESLSLCYHVWCFNCAVCGTRLGDGRAGADVRVRARKLHCHHCYSSDDGRKYSCV